MTIEPTSGVRPVPSTNEDRHAELRKSEHQLVRSRDVADDGAFPERAPRERGTEGAVESENGDRAVADPAMVPALLAMSGLRPGPAEVDAIAERFAAARRSVRRLYAVPEARHEEPAGTFSAAL